MSVRTALAVTAVAASCALVAGCGATSSASHTSIQPRHADGGIPPGLLAGQRQIGRGPRYVPALAGAPGRPCTRKLGERDEAHIELFGANRVVLLATGIGTAAPRKTVDAEVTHAACFGPVVTLSPTGTVYFRPGQPVTVGELFDAWGQRLTDTRIASFSGGPVRVYIDGHRRRIAPRRIVLTQHAEIVLEVGPYVPPHREFVYPPGPSPAPS